MKTFRQHINERLLDESVVRKGAVAVYASQGRNHGDRAVQHYRSAQRLLTTNIQGKDATQKIDLLMASMIQIVEGLISSRQQLGSVSAQITSLSVL
jgi:hypothetical protein